MNRWQRFLTSVWGTVLLVVLGVGLVGMGGWAAYKTWWSKPAVVEATKTPALPASVAEDTSATKARSGGDIAATESDLRGSLVDQRRAGVDEGMNLKGVRRMNRVELNVLGDEAWKEYRKGGGKLPKATPVPTDGVDT